MGSLKDMTCNHIIELLTRAPLEPFEDDRGKESFLERWVWSEGVLTGNTAGRRETHKVANFRQ